MSEHFDTLAAARRLKAAGVDPEQAEAHAETIAAAMRSGELATKADISALRAELAALETRMTVRFAGLMIAQAALIVALLKFL